ncbi:MAG: hypothetical protein ACXWTS_10770 [Methylococcaceae bacterium]
MTAAEKVLSEPKDRGPPAWTDAHGKRRFTPLELRVMLLRADRSIIFGRHESLP